MLPRGLLVLTVALLAAAAAPAAPARSKYTDAKLRAEAKRCVKQLAELALAAENYRSAYGSEVGAHFEVIVKQPSYSWRVALLPYLEYDNLYKTLYKETGGFTLPVSRAPAKTIGRAVPVYTLPRWKDKSGTSIFRRIKVAGKPRLFVVVESADVVPWAKSGDGLTLDPKKALPRLRGHFTGGFFALCGDGKVRFLARKRARKVVVEALISGKGVPALSVEDAKKLDKEILALDLGHPKGK
jgi:hypothetical protein